MVSFMKVKVTQLCPTLCDLTDCTVHGILQARILKSVAFPNVILSFFEIVCFASSKYSCEIA